MLLAKDFKLEQAGHGSLRGSDELDRVFKLFESLQNQGCQNINCYDIVQAARHGVVELLRYLHRLEEDSERRPQLARPLVRIRQPDHELQLLLTGDREAGH